MTEIIVLVVVCAIIIAIFYALGKRRTTEQSDVSSFIPQTKLQDSPISNLRFRIRDPRMSEDDAFERVILDAQTLPIEKHFYTKLVGTSHANDDGSSRVKAIAECHVGANLGMRLEPDNPFDPNAIAIVFDGRQLGYLDARLAGETTRDIKRNGFRFGVYMRKPTLHPTTKRIVGAVLLVIRFNKESAIKIS